MVIPVDDFPDADFPTQRLGKHPSIEGQQQAVVFGELIPEDEADRNKLRRFPRPAAGTRSTAWMRDSPGNWASAPIAADTRTSTARRHWADFKFSACGLTA
jgi:hypothetical protein